MTSTITERLIVGGSSSVAVKAPCRVATTANIALSGLLSIDGVTVEDADRVLVRAQSDAVENGVYNASTGVWARAKDFNGRRDIVRGSRIYVIEGNNGSSEWVVDTDDPQVGTGEIEFLQVTTANQGPQGVQGPPGDDGANGANGDDGESAYVYIAYASDGSGADFTTTFSASLDYIAVKATTSPIASPAAGDFTGLWKNYKGPTGATGSTGSTGAAGPAGPAAAITFLFDNGTADADPGAGKFRVNHATPASATAAYIDDLRNGGGSVAGWLSTFDDSTNTANKGSLTFLKVADPSTFQTYAVTGSVVDGTGYRKVTVAHLAGNGSLSNGDEFMALFYAAGNKGTDGGGAGDVVGPASATDAVFAQFDGTSGKLLKNGTSSPSSFAPLSHTHALADVTDAGDLAALNQVDTAEIADEAVSFAKMQSIATAKLLGRVTSGAGSIEELGEADVLTILTSITGGGGIKGLQSFTSSGTYTPTSGTTKALVFATGGGGAGGGTDGTGTGVGGGGAETRLHLVSISGTETVTIGAGGTGVSGAAGNNGAATTFGSHITANPGGGGAKDQFSYGAAGSGGSGGVLLPGGRGGPGHATLADFSNSGGGTFWGEGAPSYQGNGSGEAATIYGAGGSGAKTSTATSYAGGNGKSGFVLVIEF
jgi:hypothetical protein